MFVVYAVLYYNDEYYYLAIELPYVNGRDYYRHSIPLKYSANRYLHCLVEYFIVSMVIKPLTADVMKV